MRMKGIRIEVNENENEMKIQIYMMMRLIYPTRGNLIPIPTPRH